MQKKITKFSQPTDGVFVTKEELGNFKFIEGKKYDNGKLEVRHTKPWTKSMSDIELENKNHEKIISEIKRLDEKINELIKIVEVLITENENVKNYKNKNFENIDSTNFTWKDKLKKIVK